VNKEMQIIREVNAQAELFYGDAVNLGQHAASTFTDRHRSQLTGLENIAESAFKTTDILDYIKKQTARFRHWQQGYSLAVPSTNEGFGERLKKYLEIELPKKRDSISKKLSIGDKTDEEKQERRRVYLLLIRQFIHHMVVEYEYSVSQSNRHQGNGQRRA
jgi:hypothetical protein